MPKGADCVLIQEDAESRNGTLILTGSGPDRPGKHVRAQGSDFIKGTLLLRKGSVIRAPQVALAALGGHAVLPAHRKIKVRSEEHTSELQSLMRISYAVFCLKKKKKHDKKL